MAIQIDSIFGYMEDTVGYSLDGISSFEYTHNTRIARSYVIPFLVFFPRNFHTRF